MVPPQNPYDTHVDISSSNFYVRPITKPPGDDQAQVYPAGGLTLEGKWVPLQVNDDGTLPAPGSIASMTPHFDDAQVDTDPGLEQLLIDQTVPDGVTRYLSSVILSTRVTGIFYVLANGSLIGSGRSGPGCTPIMTFNPMRSLAAGTDYQVLFTSRPNSPIQSVECYVQANDVNTQ